MLRMLALLAALLLVPPVLAAQEVTHFVRFEVADRTAYGILDGETVRELAGPPYDEVVETGDTHAVSAVRLLVPSEPRNVVAVGFNYESHLGNREPPEKVEYFSMFVTSLVGPEDPIILFPDSRALHYEAEMAVVIGRTAQNVSVEEAMDYVFGVTAANDVSERSWQFGDIQWTRAKASDSFAAVGPAIARGLDYENLLLESRLNGDTRQSENTRDLLFGIAEMVSQISRHVTLSPGDIILTGTPQTTSPMSPGDVIEVELEGVGILRNTALPFEEVRGDVWHD